MSDYDTTVGVQLYDDFSKLKQELIQLNTQLTKIKSVMSSLSNISVNHKSFTSMTNQLNKLNNLNGLSNIATQIQQISKSVSNIDFKNIDDMKTRFKQIQQEYSKFINQMNQMSGNPVKRINSSYLKKDIKSTQNKNDYTGTRNQNITSYIQQMKKGLQEVEVQSNKTRKSINNMFSLGKVYWFLNYTKQAFRGLGNVIQSALDFTEVENYFSRAMGNMYDKAMEFNNKLSEMYGLAQSNMMQAQATYKNMIGSLGGLSDEMSYKLSETVTKMTLDFSSLYNVDFDKTVQKMQSALSKQVRPIRSVSGMDITQSVLGATASNLGITRSISQMNELEKRMLVILTLMQQMKNNGAMNDFARTIEQPSNQLRILKEQLSEVGRWIGSVFYATIGSVLPYINGFVMALKELVKTFALFVGYEMPNSSGDTGTILDSYGDSMDDFNDGISSAGSGLDSANKKVKELKGSLAGFDKLNIISKPKDDSSSGGGSGSGGGMSVDPKILDALNKYNYLFDDVQMKATKIRDRLLEWSDIAKKAFTENIFNPIRISWDKYGESTLSNYKSAFEDMKHIGGQVFDVIGNKWRPFFQSASDLFFSLKETFSLTLSTLTSMLKGVWDNGGKYLLEGIFDLVTSFIKLATSINDNFIKPVVRGFKNTLGVAISTVIGKILGLIGKVATELSKLITWLSKSKTAVVLLSTSFTALYAVIQISKFSKLWNSFKEGTSITNKLITIFAEHTKIGEKLFSSYVGGASKFSSLKDAWKSGLSVIGNLFAKMRDSVSQTNAYQLAVGGATATTEGMTLAQTLCAKATVLLQNALNFLAAHPLVAVALAVGTVVTAMIMLSDKAGDTTKKIEDCSQEIQDQAQVVRDYVSAVDSAVKSSDDQIATTQAQIKMVQTYTAKLKALSDEDGYVKNIDEAKFYIDEINKVLPNTFEITKNGQVIQKKSNEELQKSIDLLLKQSKVQAYQEVYVESLKNQIQAEQKLNEQKEKLNELYKNTKKSYDEYIKSVENGTIRVDGQVLTQEQYIKVLEEGNTELSEQIALVKDSEDNYKKITSTVDAYGNKLTEVQGETSKTTKKTKEMSAETKKAYEIIGKTGKEQINNVISTLKDYDSKISETSKKSDEASKKEVETLKRTRDQKVLQYAQMVRDYNLSYDQIINLAESNGIEFSTAEKGTIAGIVEIYKNGGTKAGDEYVRQTSLNISNGSWRIGKSAKGNVISTNELLKSVPIKYGSTVDSVYPKAEDQRKYAQDHIGGISIAVGVTGDLLKAGKKNGAQYKKGFIESATMKIASSVAGAASSILGNIKFYASGGFPDIGQMFIARENGIPEMVGRMGSRNAVANNAQIEAGIEEASYRGIARALREHGGGSNQKVVIHHQTILGKKVIEESIDEINEDHVLKTGKPKFTK